jgi:hypothetical protein
MLKIHLEKRYEEKKHLAAMAAAESSKAKERSVEKKTVDDDKKSSSSTPSLASHLITVRELFSLIQVTVTSHFSIFLDDLSIDLDD